MYIAAHLMCIEEKKRNGEMAGNGIALKRKKRGTAYKEG